VAAGKLDFLIEQGATFYHRLRWLGEDDLPIQLDGYMGRMQIREAIDAEEVLHELTSCNGQISINGPTGEIVLAIPASDTEAFAWVSGVYDLEIVSADGYVTRLIAGDVSVSPEVTR